MDGADVDFSLLLSCGEPQTRQDSETFMYNESDESCTKIVVREQYVTTTSGQEIDLPQSKTTVRATKSDCCQGSILNKDENLFDG